jgi:hypothetical protein
MLQALIAVAQNATQKVQQAAQQTNQQAAQKMVLPTLFPDFSSASTTQYVAATLDVLLVLGMLGVFFFAVFRARSGPSPYEPPLTSDAAQQKPSDMRPPREPHHVLWSGFAVRVLTAFTLVVTVVVLFNCVTSGLYGTLILTLLYGYLLRLLWPMISDTPRPHPPSVSPPSPTTTPQASSPSAT